MALTKPAIGYALSSEEHEPAQLVRHAAQAEEAGFTFALISDHFHPWIDRQGQSGLVWSTLGGIAASTSSLQLGTGVTCPLLRIHPAIIAQAAATIASMTNGRFFLGVGTGENLNGIATSLRTELPLPMHFEDASKKVTEDEIAERIPCGPDPQRHLEAIEKFADAGFDHVYVHQIGDDQEGFFRFYQQEVLPRLAQRSAHLASETPGRQAA